MFVLCQCQSQSQCQCCCYVVLNLIISPTAWAKYSLKVKQHIGKFFPHRRVKRFITGDLASLNINYLKLLLYFSLMWWSPPATNTKITITNPTFLRITFFLMMTDVPRDSVALYCPACSMSQKPPTLELTVDQWIFRSNSCNNLSKKIPFLRS